MVAPRPAVRSFRLTPEELRQVKQQMEERGKSLSDLIREGLAATGVLSKEMHCTL